MKETVLPTCEKNFVINAALENIRLDGRKWDEPRNIQINFGTVWGSCCVSLGETRVMASVMCEIQEPRTTRPNEGIININVDLNQMAAVHFESGRSSEYSILLNRFLERLIKDSKAVDLESLCIVAEEKVWTLRVDVNVLNHDGNLMDCCSIACLAALMHFKRPDVTSDGTEIKVHTASERDPIPLTLHHHPVAVTFVFLNNGEKMFLDPTNLEERVSESQVVFGVNAYKELCGLHLDGTALIKPNLVFRCSNKAAARAKQIVDLIKSSLEIELNNRQKEDYNGFVECLGAHETDRLRIQLSMFRINKITNTETKMEEDETIPEDIEEDVRIIDLGDHSAEMVVPTTAKKIRKELLKSEPVYGEGGPSSWDVDINTLDTSVMVEDSDDDIAVVEPEREEKPVESIVLSGGSEEEEVLIMKSVEKPPKKNKKRRNKK